jgi:hypothetical protein
MERRKDHAPPANWQDFEDLCLMLWRPRLIDAKKNGRIGQPQAGVDIFGRDLKTKGWVGIQCKQKGQWPPQILTIVQIEVEIQQAESFEPPLSRFIVATTAPRDTKTQEFVRKVSARRSAEGRFSVDLFAWEDLQEWLAEQPNNYSSSFRRGCVIIYLLTINYAASATVAALFMLIMSYLVDLEPFKSSMATVKQAPVDWLKFAGISCFAGTAVIIAYIASLAVSVAVGLRKGVARGLYWASCGTFASLLAHWVLMVTQSNSGWFMLAPLALSGTLALGIVVGCIWVVDRLLNAK